MMQRCDREKVLLFRRLFWGLKHVFGTYDPATGRVRQVKEPVTDRVIHDHLAGRRSYGVYLLVQDRTGAVAVDFDTPDLTGPADFVRAAGHYELPTYIERSKSKGHHIWIFFENNGLPAFKARRVVRHILEEIDQPHTEIFPKQDALDTQRSFGNFIHAPLFGRLVPEGRTVFVRPDDPTQVYPDPWELLEQVRRVPEGHLDEIMETNGLAQQEVPPPCIPADPLARPSLRPFLPPCARRILARGVPDNQRVTCFHLAVRFKCAGLPLDLAVAALKAWATKNRPENGKRIITDPEILSQAGTAYAKDYRGLGCSDPAIARYCDPDCVFFKKRGEPCQRETSVPNS